MGGVMGTKRSLVEIVHDDGYGDGLLMHINLAFGSKDMRAERVVLVEDCGQPVYRPEIWSVEKDMIYAAISALATAIGYMPQIKTDVPRWQKTLEQDIVNMQRAITELRQLPNEPS